MGRTNGAADPISLPPTQDNCGRRRSGSEDGSGRSPGSRLSIVSGSPEVPDRSAIEATRCPTGSAGRGDLRREGARGGVIGTKVVDRYESRVKIERYAHKSTANDLGSTRCAVPSPPPSDEGLASHGRTNGDRLHRYSGECRWRRGEYLLPGGDLGEGHLGALCGGDQMGGFPGRRLPVSVSRTAA